MNYRNLQLLLSTIWLSLLTVDAAAKTDFKTKSHSFSFLENKGQIVDQYNNPRADIDFKISADGVTAFIGNGAIHYQWAKPLTTEDLATEPIDNDLSKHTLNNAALDWEVYRMDVSLIGANPNARLVKAERQGYHERYYLSQFGLEGTTAYSYHTITYKDVYPNIDWVLYVKGNHIEYDFVVHPGGKVSDIQLQYDGAVELKINEDGSLTALSPMGTVSEAAPYSFQENGQFVTSAFILDEKVLRFETGSYNGVLTIDPVVEWATYFGGDGIMDEVYSSTIDRSGNVYLCGMTVSTNIATTGSFQTTLTGVQDAFLAKFNSAGERLSCTYYGGEKQDYGTGVVCDSMGNIYMCGVTGSLTGIATVGGHQTSHGGPSNRELSDAFLVKFDSAGHRQWGTYYGGSGMEGHPKLSYNGSALYMTGTTESPNAIATTGAFQQSRGGGSDAFLVKFDLDGIRQWGTYYGGRLFEGFGISIACDPYGSVYISGSTLGILDIDANGNYQNNLAGGRDAFLVKFDSSGARQWCTYYGGEKNDGGITAYNGNSLSCDLRGNIYLTGQTESTTGIATVGSHQDTYGGNIDAFLVKFDSSGERLWGTYFGGDDEEANCNVFVLDSGRIFIAGSTESTSGIATQHAIQSAYMGSLFVGGDVYLAQFDEQGMQEWGSYYGGTGDDWGMSVVGNSSGDIYLSGLTNSFSGIATPGSFQDDYSLLGPALVHSFLAKLCSAPSPFVLVVNGDDSICANGSSRYSIPPIDDATAYIWTLPSGWTGSSDSNSIEVSYNVTTGGTIGVQVVRCNDTSAIKSYDVVVRPRNQPVITTNEFVLGTTEQYNSYQWLLNDIVIPSATERYYTVQANGDYRVATVNSFGCIDTSEVNAVNNYTGIVNSQALKQSIKIYPNPTSGRVFIQSPVRVSLTLSNVEGRILIQESNSSSIDISQLHPGIYLLHVQSKEGTLLKTERLVKIVQ